MREGGRTDGRVCRFLDEATAGRSRRRRRRRAATSPLPLSFTLAAEAFEARTQHKQLWSVRPVARSSVFFLSVEVTFLAASKASSFHARPSISPARPFSFSRRAAHNGHFKQRRRRHSRSPLLNFLPDVRGERRRRRRRRRQGGEGARNCALFALERTSLLSQSVSQSVSQTRTHNLPRSVRPLRRAASA